ncbi:MAG: carboxymuconolactone decarboxylase family protein, partial [Corynebacterium sp.]|nr:carboxymuconolactone decarboxylase family protein [Corynebacterium sp.]
FSPQQFAALELAEALTVVDGTADAVADATEVFSPEQVAALEWAIILINSYNRISIGSGHPPAGAR